MRRVILAAALVLCAVPGGAAGGDPESFEHWLAGFESFARTQGISRDTLAETLGRLQPDQRVLARDRNQPETILALDEYLDRVVSPARVAAGRRHLASLRGLLEPLQRRYGVAPSLLVALWGIETDFGRVTGDFAVFRSLATLAHDRRRRAFFREELLYALRIVEAGYLPAGRMTGSWAGAMGDLQFLPSTYFRFGVDQDADGRVEIWRGHADVFATAANFLSASGWSDALPWGAEARLPAEPLPDGPQALAAWRAAGVETGPSLLGADPQARFRLLRPDGAARRAFLVSRSFDALLAWNRSHKFALSAARLSELLAATGGDAQASNP